MMFFVPNKVRREFGRNFADWHEGGPKPGGWTRSGASLPKPTVELSSYRLNTISTEDGLAKNRNEVTSWHLSFLLNPYPLQDTEYYRAYLSVRYDKESAVARATSFLELLNDISLRGVRKPVWVADVRSLGLGFPYFRFDGCHRLCCAKHLGIDQVPAIIFRVEEYARIS